MPTPTQELIDEVKEELRISWDTEDMRISKMIERAMNYLNNLVGTELDYTLQDDVKELLLNYCRYSYNNALEYFLENFSMEITRIQLRVAADIYALESDAT